MSTYDVIVIGTGGVGSAAAFHLAKDGNRVLALDRFPAGHDRGSSHGHTRIIRKAYFEHADYVPLLNRAYELWADLEAELGEQLYFPSGLIEIGPPDGVVVPGVLHAAEQHDLPVERLLAEEVARRFPGFQVEPDQVAVFEQDAGYLLVEDCVRGHAARAAACGAELRHHEEVLRWEASQSSVTVTTSDRQYEAASLVITAGAWSSRLLADLGIPLRVLRKHLHWFATESSDYDFERGCPAFFYEVAGEYYYGFPAIDARGLKVAEHSGGTEAPDPLTDDRLPEEAVDSRVRSFLANYLPGVTDKATDHAVCFYTVSPDEHFIVDRHPAYPHVAFAAGLSGHGFKFTSALGEVLAELATARKPVCPIEFLSCRRPGLTD